jgi:hypothetical protein
MNMLTVSADYGITIVQPEAPNTSLTEPFMMGISHCCTTYPIINSCVL